MRRLVTITKHTITLEPVFFERMDTYVHYFISEGTRKLQEYRAQKGGNYTDDYTTKTQQVIDQAKEVFEAIRQWKQHHYRIYTVNFEAIATALRQTRIGLGVSRIEEMYSLEFAVLQFTPVLRKLNDKFDAEKFRDFINTN